MSGSTTANTSEISLPTPLSPDGLLSDRPRSLWPQAAVDLLDPAAEPYTRGCP